MKSHTLTLRAATLGGVMYVGYRESGGSGIEQRFCAFMSGLCVSDGVRISEGSGGLVIMGRTWY